MDDEGHNANEPWYEETPAHGVHKREIERDPLTVVVFRLIQGYAPEDAFDERSTLPEGVRGFRQAPPQAQHRGLPDVACVRALDLVAGVQREGGREEALRRELGQVQLPHDDALAELCALVTVERRPDRGICAARAAGVGLPLPGAGLCALVLVQTKGLVWLRDAWQADGRVPIHQYLLPDLGVDLGDELDRGGRESPLGLQLEVAHEGLQAQLSHASGRIQVVLLVAHMDVRGRGPHRLFGVLLAGHWGHAGLVHHDPLLLHLSPQLREAAWAFDVIQNYTQLVVGPEANLICTLFELLRRSLEN
mmetsp:Transcript_100996/g.324287  ORF Transcript_100996/g.324287 Transcript_100996/m.324287 type:complete len:306 (+) Transcript_100996:1615-2532(+)